MLDAFQAFIAKHQLFEQDHRLLLAISGGRDSVVLAHLLRKIGFSFGLAHANHGLRDEESDLDETFVKELAEQWSVPCFCRRFDLGEEKGKSTQMKARELRYSFLEEIRSRNGFDFILTAHHLDDNLETFLINFSRGTGLSGLRGMPVKTGHIRRPLLFASRIAIDRYVAEHEIAYREDSSNAERKYLRNQIRHDLLSLWYEQSPSLGEVARRNFQELREAEQLQHWAVDHWLSNWTLEKTTDFWKLDRNAVHESPYGALVIREWLRPLGFDREAIRQVKTAKTGTILAGHDCRLLLATAYLLIDFREEVDSSENFPIHAATFRLDLPSTGEQLTGDLITIDPGTDLLYAKHEALISADQLVYPLAVRHKLPGDSFQPLGLHGKHQRLQDYFVDKKVDRIDRERTWVLLNGNGQIIWIVGHRLDERFKINAETRQALHCVLRTN